MEIHARMRRQRIIIPTDGKEGEVFDTDFSLTSDDAVPMRFRGDSSRQSTDKNYTQADIDIMITIVEEWQRNDNATNIAFRTRQLQNGSLPSFGFVIASLKNNLLAKADHCIIDRSFQYNIGDQKYYDYCWEDKTRFSVFLGSQSK